MFKSNKQRAEYFASHPAVGQQQRQAAPMAPAKVPQMAPVVAKKTPSFDALGSFLDSKKKMKI